MTISINGIGWTTQNGYGCIRSRLHHAFNEVEGVASTLKQEVFSFPFKNFGRLDETSRMTAYAVALALKDAGLDYAPERKQDIGIIGTSSTGSLRSDIEYFKDYLAGGRTLARGNLFIYTLPSSPLGEAAIHFGLAGPLLYAAGKENSLRTALDLAEESILNNETRGMLVGRAEKEEALYLVLRSDQAGNALCDLAQARAIVHTTPTITALIRHFSLVTDRKGFA